MPLIQHLQEKRNNNNNQSPKQPPYDESKIPNNIKECIETITNNYPLYIDDIEELYGVDIHSKNNIKHEFTEYFKLLAEARNMACEFMDKKVDECKNSPYAKDVEKYIKLEKDKFLNQLEGLLDRRFSRFNDVEELIKTYSKRENEFTNNFGKMYDEKGNPTRRSGSYVGDYCSYQYGREFKTFAGELDNGLKTAYELGLLTREGYKKNNIERKYEKTEEIAAENFGEQMYDEKGNPTRPSNIYKNYQESRKYYNELKDAKQKDTNSSHLSVQELSKKLLDEYKKILENADNLQLTEEQEQER